MKIQMKRIAALWTAALAASSANALPANDFGIRASDFVLQKDNIYDFGLKNSKTLALTFDDGPGDGEAKILDLLKQYGIKATFFVIGQTAKEHPDRLQRIIAEGHILGNHSYTHPHLNAGVYKAHPEQLVQELQETDDTIRPFEPGGANMYFRAPYGDWNAQDANTLNKAGDLWKYIGPIYWDIGGEIDKDAHGNLTDAADWDCWDHNMQPADCMKGYLAKIASLKGGVVLSHDIYTQTADMWEMILPVLVKQGYKFVTLDQVQALEPFRQEVHIHGNFPVADPPSVGAKKKKTR